MRPCWCGSSITLTVTISRPPCWIFRAVLYCGSGKKLHWWWEWRDSELPLNLLTSAPPSSSGQRQLKSWVAKSAGGNIVMDWREKHRGPIHGKSFCGFCWPHRFSCMQTNAEVISSNKPRPLNLKTFNQWYFLHFCSNKHDCWFTCTLFNDINIDRDHAARSNLRKKLVNCYMGYVHCSLYAAETWTLFRKTEIPSRLWSVVLEKDGEVYLHQSWKK